MTAPAATLATFADFRLIKTRKLAQFVFELPIEKADEALAALGGLPRSDGERWCGIALVTTGPQTPASIAVSSTTCLTPDAESKGADKPGKSKHNSRTFQAVMACKTEQFREWVRAWSGLPEPIDEDEAAGWVRLSCDVTSRSQLDTNITRGKAWDAIYLQYQKDMGLMAEER